MLDCPCLKTRVALDVPPQDKLVKRRTAMASLSLRGVAGGLSNHSVRYPRCENEPFFQRNDGSQFPSLRQSRGFARELAAFHSDANAGYRPLLA